MTEIQLWDRAAATLVADPARSSKELLESAASARAAGAWFASTLLERQAEELDLRQRADAVLAIGGTDGGTAALATAEELVERGHHELTHRLLDQLDGLRGSDRVRQLVVEMQLRRRTGSTPGSCSRLAAEAHQVVADNRLDPGWAGWVHLEEVETYRGIDNRAAYLAAARALSAYQRSGIEELPGWVADRTEGVLRSHYGMATAGDRLGKRSEVINTVQKALQIEVRTERDLYRLSQLLREGSESAQHQGLVETLRRLDREAQRIGSVAQLAETRALVLRGRGRVARFFGHYEQALALTRSAVEATSSRLRFSRANTLVSLGNTQRDLLMYEEATETYREAEKLYRHFHGQRGLRAALVNLARTAPDLAARHRAIDEVFATAPALISMYYLRRAELTDRAVEDRRRDHEAAWRVARDRYGNGPLAAQRLLQWGMFLGESGLRDPDGFVEELELSARILEAADLPGMAAQAALAAGSRLTGHQGVELLRDAVRLFDKDRQRLVSAYDRDMHLVKRRKDYAILLGTLVDRGAEAEAALAVEQLRADALAVAATTGLAGMDEELRSQLEEILASYRAKTNLSAASSQEDGWDAPETSREDPGDQGDSTTGRRRAASALYEESFRRLCSIESALHTHLLSGAVSPPAWTPQDLDSRLEAAAAGGAWVYYAALTPFVDPWQLVCVWRLPGGRWSASRIAVSGRAFDLLAALAADPVGAPQRVWAHHLVDLGRRLFPEELEAWILCQGSDDAPALTIVPSAELWAAPWNGVRVGGLPLVRLVPPTLALSGRHQDIVGGRRNTTAGVGGIALLDRDLRTEQERVALEEAGVETAADVDTWKRALAAAAGRLTVVSAHGVGAPGLAQGFSYRGRIVTAAELMSVSFPVNAVFGSCRVASARPSTEREPIGLPAVILANGATSFVGGLYDIPDEPAAMILASYYRRLHDGASGSANALRLATLEYLDEPRRDRSLGAVAGLVHFGLPT